MFCLGLLMRCVRSTKISSTSFLLESFIVTGGCITWLHWWSSSSRWYSFKLLTWMTRLIFIHVGSWRRYEVLLTFSITSIGPSYLPTSRWSLFPWKLNCSGLNLIKTWSPSWNSNFLRFLLAHFFIRREAFSKYACAVVRRKRNKCTHNTNEWNYTKRHQDIYVVRREEVPHYHTTKTLTNMSLEKYNVTYKTW